MSKPLIFLSHSARDAKLVQGMRDWIDATLLGGVDFFQSSDEVSLRPGSVWFHEIVSALARCQIVLVVVTPEMLRSNWTFFEAGGGHLRGVQVVPVCGFGVGIEGLPSPLNELSAVDVSLRSGQLRLLHLLATAASLRLPADPAELQVSVEPPLASLRKVTPDPGLLGSVSHESAVQMFHENLVALKPVVTEVLISGASLTDFVHLRTNALVDASRSPNLKRLSIVVKGRDMAWSEATRKGMAFEPPYDATDSDAMLAQASRDMRALREQVNGVDVNVELVESEWPPTYAAASIVTPTQVFGFFEPMLFGHQLAKRHCFVYAERAPSESFLRSLREAHDRMVANAVEVV